MRCLDTGVCTYIDRFLSGALPAVETLSNADPTISPPSPVRCQIVLVVLGGPSRIIEPSRPFSRTIARYVFALSHVGRFYFSGPGTGAEADGRCADAEEFIRGCVGEMGKLEKLVLGGEKTEPGSDPEPSTDQDLEGERTTWKLVLEVEGRGVGSDVKKGSYFGVGEGECDRIPSDIFDGSNSNSNLERVRSALSADSSVIGRGLREGLWKGGGVGGTDDDRDDCDDNENDNGHDHHQHCRKARSVKLGSMEFAEIELIEEK